jgi:hypothetical protein
VAAVTTDLHDVLIRRIATVVAAIRGITIRRTAAHFMSTFSFVSHFGSSDDFEGARIQTY